MEQVWTWTAVPSRVGPCLRRIRPLAWLVDALAAAIQDLTSEEQARVRELVQPRVQALGAHDLNPLLDVLVSIKDAGVGAVAATVVSATGKKAMALVRSRRSRKRPSEVQVKSAARWAINLRWPDAEVSAHATFLEEVYSPTGWRLALADSDWRYEVSAEYADDGAITLRRERIRGPVAPS